MTNERATDVERRAQYDAIKVKVEDALATPGLEPHDLTHLYSFADSTNANERTTDVEVLIEELSVASAQLMALAGWQKRGMESTADLSATDIASLCDRARAEIVRLSAPPTGDVVENECGNGGHCCCCDVGEPCCDCGEARPSAACVGENCFCGKQAAKKIGEEILSDEPNPNRHNLTSYVCAGHYALIMGPVGAEQVGVPALATLHTRLSAPPTGDVVEEVARALVASDFGEMPPAKMDEWMARDEFAENYRRLARTALATLHRG